MINNHPYFMPEKKKEIIRTALDPTPDGIIEDDWDMSKDPTIIRRAAEAEPYIQAFIRQYGTPKKPTEEMK